MPSAEAVYTTASCDDGTCTPLELRIDKSSKYSLYVHVPETGKTYSIIMRDLEIALKYIAAKPEVKSKPPESPNSPDYGWATRKRRAEYTQRIQREREKRFREIDRDNEEASRTNASTSGYSTIGF